MSLELFEDLLRDLCVVVGLPDPEQISTARDMALLARRLIVDFPSEYRYFSTPSFMFHGHMILNHDMMLQRYPGADGLKTGYTIAAGHNLTTSAVRGDVRLIGVVLGAASNPERDAHMMALLDQGFESMDVPVGLMHRDLPPPTFHLMASAQASPLLRRAALRHAPLAEPPRVVPPPKPLLVHKVAEEPAKRPVKPSGRVCAPNARCPA